MSHGPTRRDVLRAGQAGGVMSFLSGLPAVSAEEAKLDPKVVRLDPDIEPLVRLLEETPRDRLLEEVGARVKKGLTYREVLAALLLAGVRERPAAAAARVQVPRGAGGELGAPGEPGRRRTPTAGCRSSGRSTTSRTRRPRTSRRRRLADAAGGRIEGAAARTGARGVHRRRWTTGTPRPPTPPRPAWRGRPGADEVFDLFCRYGARDFRDIGHKIDLRLPTASARWTASAGSTPSRCSARWRTRCSTTKATTPPSATTRPTGPAGGTPSLPQR